MTHSDHDAANNKLNERLESFVSAVGVIGIMVGLISFFFMAFYLHTMHQYREPSRLSLWEYYQLVCWIPLSLWLMFAKSRISAMLLFLTTCWVSYSQSIVKYHAATSYVVCGVILLIIYLAALIVTLILRVRQKTISCKIKCPRRPYKNP
jgi:hypothetical protein